MPLRTAASKDLLYAWLVATVLSGIPSTVHALATGGDPLEATRAAGAMLVPSASDTLTLLAAAAVVHSTVSFFWALVLVLVLPRPYIAVTAVLASAAIALLDLKLIAPRVFPEVAALPFWPQFADHLAWGACVGLTLMLRRRRRDSEVNDAT